MNIESVREYCLSKPYATESFPFDEETLVFKVGGKMFMVILLEKPDLIIMKCDPDYAIELRDRYAGIAPAWHFNKKHWNQVELDADVPDKLVRTLIDHSYDLVVAKLPKSIRESFK